MTRILVGLQEGTAVTEPKGELADLYVRHVPAANRLAFLLTGDRSQAEDLVHDAFVRCVGRFGHLRAHEAFDAKFFGFQQSVELGEITALSLPIVLLEELEIVAIEGIAAIGHVGAMDCCARGLGPAVNSIVETAFARLILVIKAEHDIDHWHAILNRDPLKSVGHRAT